MNLIIYYKNVKLLTKAYGHFNHRVVSQEKNIIN